jgi:hypothetical protein
MSEKCHEETSQMQAEQKKTPPEGGFSIQT